MLNSLITSKTRLRLLIKFFISQANRGYLNGLANEMGESTNSIRKELNHLYDAGYLEKVKNDNKVEYKVNSKHPLYNTLPPQKPLTQLVSFDEETPSVDFSMNQHWRAHPPAFSWCQTWKWCGVQ